MLSHRLRTFREFPICRSYVGYGAKTMEFLHAMAGFIHSASQPVRSGDAAFIGLSTIGTGGGDAALAAPTADRRPGPGQEPIHAVQSDAADQMRDFNTDRPTKSNVPYTVDAGHFQYEGDLFIYGFDNTSTPDTDNTSWVVGNPTFKLGPAEQPRLRGQFLGLQQHRATTRSTSVSTIERLRRHLHAVQDQPVRQRRRRTGLGADPLRQVADRAEPQGIGNRFVEGGLIAPLAMPLPLGFTGILMGEIDNQKNPNDAGYHVNFPALINVSRQIVETSRPMPSSMPTGRPIARARHRHRRLRAGLAAQAELPARYRPQCRSGLRGDAVPDLRRHRAALLTREGRAMALAGKQVEYEARCLGEERHMRRTWLLATTWLTASLLMMAACAGRNEKDQYNLFNPTPADKMRSFSTDQPPSTGQP